MKKARILLIYTGGTIGMAKDFQTGTLKAFHFEKITERLPELSFLDCEIDTISFSQPIDSSDMNPILWTEIATIIQDNYNAFDGFVILHGSDTMSYSASALSFMLENLSKPVIFTGSQLPIGDLRTDARENLITSIQLASLKENKQAIIQEVCLYFEYKLYRANRTTKIDAENFQAFASMNYPTLAESGVHLKINREYLFRRKNNVPLSVFNQLDTNVAIIKIFPGISEKILNGFLSINGLKAVVLETYGSGNAPTGKWFLDTLSDAIKRGLHIVNVTQCAGGTVMPGIYDAGSYFDKIGIINGKDITTEAAISKLMFLLGKNINAKELKIRFETPICGEISKKSL